MLNDATKIQILAVHAAVKPDETLRNVLIAAYAGSDNRRILEGAWRAIGAHACLRQLARGGNGSASAFELSQLEQCGDTFLWQGEEIGKLLTLYKPPLPEEWQARIAYESFLDRFVVWAQVTHQWLLLYEREQSFTCFIGTTLQIEIEKLWSDFIEYAFSEIELQKTFILMLNSIDIGDSFHTIDIPIVTQRQGKILAAYFFAFQHALKTMFEWRERKIHENREHVITLKQRLEGNNLLPNEEKSIKRKIESLEKESEKLQKELAEKYEKHTPSLAVFDDVIGALPLSERNELRRMALLFSNNALSKLTARPDSVQNRFKKIPELLYPSSLYAFPVLLSPMALAPDNRIPGDLVNSTCYLCGRELNKGERVKGNKIILSSPSQTPQSGYSQKTTQPVCGVCANLAFISPIKFGGDAFVIRLREPISTKEYRYLLEDHLRMFVLGELNVYAGRYVMLTCTEKIGNNSLMKEFSREPYALWKVATLFPADVFRSYLVEAIIEGAQVVLPGRHLAWLSSLMDVFGAVKTPYQLENDKSKLTAVKKSLRHIQHEEVLFAIYELTKAFMAERQGGFSPVEASRLEDLRALHVWWLENNSLEETERRSRMGDLMHKARLFRDVAGLTGILYAFATHVRSKADPQKAEREVEKLLEKVDEPNHFIYDAAGGLQGTAARLWRGPDTHFIYAQAKALLEEAGADVHETTENGKPSLQVFFDDISKVYTYLFETRYQTEKDQRDFTYQVKLSLYARFPEYLGKKKEA
ncbi:MAG: prefoldin domain-containing protein [Anaerolineales bacterium]